MSRRVIGPGNSCRECRRRKIKCSRSMPCSYCVKTEIECVYPVPSSRSSKNPTAAVDGDVLARLETVERTLRTFELELSHLRHVQPTPPSSSSVRSAAPSAEQMGQDTDSLDTLVAQVVIPFLLLDLQGQTITTIVEELRTHHSQPMNRASAKAA